MRLGASVHQPKMLITFGKNLNLLSVCLGAQKCSKVDHVVKTRLLVEKYAVMLFGYQVLLVGMGLPAFFRMASSTLNLQPQPIYEDPKGWYILLESVSKGSVTCTSALELAERGRRLHDDSRWALPRPWPIGSRGVMLTPCPLLLEPSVVRALDGSGSTTILLGWLPVRLRGNRSAQPERSSDRSSSIPIGLTHFITSLIS